MGARVSRKFSTYLGKTKSSPRAHFYSHSAIAISERKQHEAHLFVRLLVVDHRVNAKNAEWYINAELLAEKLRERLEKLMIDPDWVLTRIKCVILHFL